MNQTQRIFAFHLLNDRSGSPKVLSQLVQSWVKDGKEVHLYTSPHQNGFLSEIEGVHYYKGWYRFQSNPWLRLLYYTWSQLLLIVNMMDKIKKNDIVYINTVLPFGAAILGKLKGARVIYHIHESTVNPAILKWFLFKIVRSTANDLIMVSKYVQAAHQIETVPNHLVYNAIEDSFLDQVRPKTIKSTPQNVLMICSLKTYKGVFEFVQLAADHPNYAFRLVLNATHKEIDLFFQGQTLPANLKLFAAQKNVHPFFHWADIVVNLSKPDMWVETFGLTIIEGMVYGLPALVPPVGGILEVIEEGVTGYSVDSRHRNHLNLALQNLMGNPDSYQSMSVAAKERVAFFGAAKMNREIVTILDHA